ncbi:hypothetical protein AGMMS50276_09120 [Synergistales bacterium]|nr:hypothetical protein AGMMS50276_09120 [Synergistales bacterium]
MLKNLLAHPLAKGMDLDSVETTLRRRRIIREKPFLRKLYAEWYRLLLNSVPDMVGGILELGSGAGFLKDFNKAVITSEVFKCDGIDMQIDACNRTPFNNGELKAILMTDVFHHLPNVGGGGENIGFFKESARIVASGGVISMIEPWVTPWSRLIYTKLHHEPFDTAAQNWEFESTGPLSGANGALPWIVFERDIEKFRHAHPEWLLESARLMMPFAYLFSGGVSMRALFPGWGYPLIRGAENLLGRFNKKIAMFAHIVLRKL